MAYTTSKTRERLYRLAQKCNINPHKNGYAVNLLHVHWASEEEVNDYFNELTSYWWSCNFLRRRDCAYIVIDTICENEYGSTYSNGLWSVVPINELPERMARQVANMLNNGINYCEV